jgi:hypothetical protein
MRVGFGVSNVLLLDSEGQAYIASGPSSMADVNIRPITVDGVDRFVDAGAGNGQQALVTDTGRLFMWGATS